MDNPAMARLLAETADLLEIDGGDTFRIRSYRKRQWTSWPPRRRRPACLRFRE